MLHGGPAMDSSRFQGSGLQDLTDIRCRAIHARRGQPDLSGHFKDEWNTTDLRPVLARVTCPVLVIGGELDPICPIEAVRDVADAMPSQFVRLVEIQGASHLEAAADEIAPFVRDFVLESSS
jgi:pimeloyl-ACP methyl ester carboxylesterase